MRSGCVSQGDAEGLSPVSRQGGVCCTGDSRHSLGCQSASRASTDGGEGSVQAGAVPGSQRQGWVQGQGQQLDQMGQQCTQLGYRDRASS